MTYHTIQIVQRLAPGGIEVLASRLAAEIPGRNAIISLEGSTDELRAAWPAISNVDVIGLEKAGGVSLRTVMRLSALLRRLLPRCVITHHVGPLLYGGLAARLAGVRTLVHVEHDVWHHEEPRRRAQLRLARWLLHPTFVAISEGAAAALQRAVGGARMTVIPNGVDLGRYGATDRAVARQRLGLSGSQPVIGCVGRLERVKGHAMLVRALRLLPDEVRAVVVGDGSQRLPLQRLAAELGVTSRLQFTGHRDDVQALYPAFDVLCLPSEREGLPLVVIEAQACGTPVVATDVGAVRDALCPETSRLVPAGDVAALARALADTIAAPATSSPRAFVARFFDWDATVRRYTILAKG